MPSISIPAIIGGVASIGSAVIGSQAAGKAASTQAAAAGQAAQLQMEQYRATQAALSPFISAGASALPMAQGLLGIAPGSGPATTTAAQGQSEQQILAQIKQGLQDWRTSVPSGGAQGIVDMIDKGAPLEQVRMALNAASATTTHPKNVAWLGQIQSMAQQMPMAEVQGGQGPLGTNLAQPFSPQEFLEQTPGYKFALDQGLKSTQAGYSARGLGGASLKGAGEFAVGLADQTYGQQVARYMDLAKLGAGSAASLGQTGASQVGQIGDTMTGGAAAQAAGTMGQANALGAGLQGLGTAGSNYFLQRALQSKGLFKPENISMFFGRK